VRCDEPRPDSSPRSTPATRSTRQLEITDLALQGDTGQVTTRATIHNQHGQLVMERRAHLPAQDSPTGHIGGDVMSFTGVDDLLGA
jgi:hypothetical protein